MTVHYRDLIFSLLRYFSFSWFSTTKIQFLRPRNPSSAASSHTHTLPAGHCTCGNRPAGAPNSEACTWAEHLWKSGYTTMWGTPADADVPHTGVRSKTRGKTCTLTYISCFFRGLFPQHHEGFREYTGRSSSSLRASRHRIVRQGKDLGNQDVALRG